MNRNIFRKPIHNIFRVIAIVLTIAIIINCSVVTEAAGKRALDKKKLTLHVGSTYTLTLSNATAVSWKSSKKKVATVNSKGKITAKKKGTCTITCTDSKGNKYKCKVTVKKHTYKTIKKVSATRNKKGYAVYQCTECSKVYRKSTVYSPSEATVRKDIMALKAKYPEGTKWTLNNHYTWDASIYYDGVTCVGGGCVAFAFMASDAAFGKFNKSKKISGSGWYKKIRVGDIIRVANGGHSVVVLKKKKNSIVVVEGSYNNSVHWGRELSMDYIKKSGKYLVTRYPD